jgi:hypothetical protein
MPWRHIREWRYSSTILDIGNRWRWVVSFTPRPRYPRGKSPRYLMDRRVNGAQSRFGRCGEEKNLAMSGIEPGRSSPYFYSELAKRNPARKGSMPLFRIRKVSGSKPGSESPILTCFFASFFAPYSQISVKLKLGHDCSLSYPSPFIVH